MPSHFYSKQYAITSDNFITLLDTSPIILKHCTLSIKTYIISGALQDMNLQMGETTEALSWVTTFPNSKISGIEFFRQFEFRNLRLDTTYLKVQWGKTGLTTIVSLVGTYEDKPFEVNHA